MQAILTELIFNHSLRLRVKADASQPDSSGSASNKNQGSNALGKLYNLATSDITYIIEGREFLHRRKLLLLLCLGSEVVRVGNG